MFTEENFRQGLGGFAGTLISAVGISIGDLESLVSIICSIVGLLITIIFVIVIPVIKKIIVAKKNDGKIDEEEMKDIVDTFQEGIEKAKSDLDKINKK